MTQHSQHLPATEVWRRFAGMFGADAVARKYGNAIPDEWHAMLARLNEHQIGRGVRMLAYSGKGHVPSLPEFVKLCRDAEHDREVSDKVALPNPDNWQGDSWDIESSHHLLGHITRQSKAGVHYCSDTMRFGHLKAELPDQETKDLTAPLVTFKHAWARDCREHIDEKTGEIGKPDEATKKRWWVECMRLADEQVNEVRAHYAQRRA
jgi:hypothetical protein